MKIFLSSLLISNKIDNSIAKQRPSEKNKYQYYSVATSIWRVQTSAKAYNAGTMFVGMIIQI